MTNLTAVPLAAVIGAFLLVPLLVYLLEHPVGRAVLVQLVSML